MTDLLWMKQWGWKTSGLALGLIIVIALVLVKPIGVSTQYVIFDGILWNVINPEIAEVDTATQHGFKSSNPYLNKSDGKYAKAVAEPIRYGLIFVLSMIAGGFLARKFRSDDTSDADSVAILTRQQRFGSSPLKRSIAAMLGGMLVLYGARMAGGCTSGHMMSGMMQTSISAYVFTVAVFLVAIPTALLLYQKDTDLNNG